MSNEPFKWTEEAYQFLDEQLRSGASRVMIANAFTERYGRTFTKGSISGAVDRRWSGGHPEAGKAIPKIKVEHGKQTVVRLNKKKLTPVIAQPRELPSLHWVATCKWIDGDPMAGEYTVCGQPAAIKPNGDAKPYCPHHCSIAYLKPRERAAERQPETVA